MVTGRLYHPGIGETVNYLAEVVSDDPATQTGQVIGIMRRWVRADYHTPEIQARAQEHITSDVVADIYDYTHGALQFVRDEETAAPIQPGYDLPIVETLVRPRDMAIMGRPQGDCDDFTMYAAALLMSQGVPVSFVTVKADPREPDNFSHVYLAAYPQFGPWAGQRVALDLSHGLYPGWETPSYFGERAEWPVEDRTGLLVAIAAAAGVAAWYFTRPRRAA